MKNVTQTVSMVCAVLMDPVRMDATIKSMELDVERHVRINVFTASVNITALNVFRDIGDCIAEENAKQPVTTVLNSLFVDAAILVFMVGHVQSVVLRNVKRVNLQIDVVLAEKAGLVHYANVVKTVLRKPVEMMGNVMAVRIPFMGTTVTSPVPCRDVRSVTSHLVTVCCVQKVFMGATVSRNAAQHVWKPPVI